MRMKILWRRKKKLFVVSKIFVRKMKKMPSKKTTPPTKMGKKSNPEKSISNQK